MGQAKPSTAVHPASKSDEIIGKENSFQRFYVTDNIPELEKLMLPDFIDVEQLIMGRNQFVNVRKRFREAGCNLLPVKIIEPKVVFLSADIATIVYHSTETANCGGRTFSGNTNISTVWVHRDGGWQMHIHTEYTDLSK